MNKELLKMQKLAGIITESQYKEKLNEVATTPDFSKKITVSKNADVKRVAYTLTSMYPSGREDIDKRNLAKSIFEKVKASSDGLTVSEIAKALKVEENEVKDLMSELSSKSIFNIERLSGRDISGNNSDKKPGRPTINEAETNLLTADGLRTLLYSLTNSINDGNKKLSMDIIEQLLSIARGMEDANKEKNKDFYNDVMKLSEMQGEEYDVDTVKGSDYADDPGYNDKVAFLADTFQYVWGMGKGNNTINFDGMAKSTIEDLETRF